MSTKEVIKKESNTQLIKKDSNLLVSDNIPINNNAIFKASPEKTTLKKDLNKTEKLNLINSTTTTNANTNKSNKMTFMKDNKLALNRSSNNIRSQTQRNGKNNDDKNNTTIMPFSTMNKNNKYFPKIDFYDDKVDYLWQNQLNRNKSEQKLLNVSYNNCNKGTLLTLYKNVRSWIIF